LACLEDQHGRGRPQKIPEGSEEFIALYNLSQKDEEHWKIPFEDIAKGLEIQAAQSTLEHVFHDQHGLFRSKATHKPFLSPQHMESPLAFCHMALNISIREIVFTDERLVHLTRFEDNEMLQETGELTQAVGNS